MKKIIIFIAKTGLYIIELIEKVKKMYEKTITIRKALTEDKNYLDYLAKEYRISAAEALSMLVKQAKNNANNEGNEEIKNQLKTANETAAAAIEIAETYKQELEEIAILVKPILEDNEEATTNAIARAINAAQEATKTIEIEKPLQKNQFICELNKENFINARKIRSFAKKEGFIEDTENPNELINIALKQFINRHFSELI